MLQFRLFLRTKIDRNKSDDPPYKKMSERLFSFLKLVKMEGPDHLSDDQLETLVNNFKDYACSLTKSGEIRIKI